MLKFIVPIVPQDARFMSSISDEIKTMATEKSEGILDHISSFSQGGIVLRSRLDEDRKSHLEVRWVYITT